MAGSMMPADVKEQMARARGSGGVGGGARENADTARQRAIAMGGPDPTEEEAPAPAEEEEATLKICPNTRCGEKLDDAWNFCSKCGQELLRPGFAGNKLGLTFTEKDVEDYIFKGYVVRELPFLGKHKVTLKSSQARDLEQIDAFIMNGAWAKDETGAERRVSDFFLRQMNSLSVTAASVMKIDGAPIGDTLELRLDYIKDKGSAFVDLLSERVTLFNRALTEYLRKVDTLSGS